MRSSSDFDRVLQPERSNPFFVGCWPASNVGRVFGPIPEIESRFGGNGGDGVCLATDGD
jgi:hypothetical protein